MNLAKYCFFYFFFFFAVFWHDTNANLVYLHAYPKFFFVFFPCILRTTSTPLSNSVKKRQNIYGV